MSITENQLKLRRQHIGSSDSPALFGLDPWRNRADIYWSKVADVPDDDPGPAAMLGNVLEDALINHAAVMLELPLTRNQYRVSSADPVFSATHDALARSVPEGVEVKTVGLIRPSPDWDAWGEDGSQEIPARVRVQVQHQMLVSDLQRVYVVALIAGRGIQIHPIEREDLQIQMIREEGLRFWREHVERRIAPDSAPPPMGLLKTLERQPEARVRIDPDLVRRYEAAQAAVKELTAEKDAALRCLIAALGEAELGEIGDGRLFAYRSERSSSLDSKRLKAEQPDIYAAFVRQGTRRVPRIVKDRSPSTAPDPGV
jgi:putative phage-type endonuclease